MGQYWAKVARKRDPIFVSLGMVVIDELRFPYQPTLSDIPGGSGLYATLGARLFNPGLRSTAVGCLILAGNDFPEVILRSLQSWKMRLRVHKVEDKPSTRGLLVYKDTVFGKKSFSYVTPRLQPSPRHLEGSNLLRSKSFHILASPDDLVAQVSALRRLRDRYKIPGRPLIIWEPAPLTCDISTLVAHLEACKHVDVFSPNHLELGYLVEGKEKGGSSFSKSAIESQARTFLHYGVGQNGQGLVVVRCGEHGSLTLSGSGAEWLPPFYDKPTTRVVDPTGAGNAFLGGFAAAFQETGDAREASICGAVAASYAIEQFGVPKLSRNSYFSEELWNGTSVWARTEEFKQRLAGAGVL
ncbi:hypothetical protein DL767_000132 [Monosporascus sp. MG133]|nr:hypothetical protein DL767_000132 [Monosporascus sp. MG133]